MIHTIVNILNLYIAMLLHYFLKWPYALKVIIIIVLAIYVPIRIIVAVIRKCVLPILFITLNHIIYFLQLVTLAIVKIRPNHRKMAEKFDDSLNALGMKLIEWNEQPKTNLTVKYQKIMSSGLLISLCASVIFIIVPYYMEPSLSGNAKEICSKVNQITYKVQSDIQSYADRYYIPVIKVEDDSGTEEEAITAPVPEAPTKYILHLGKEGYSGANLRSSPEKTEYNVITAIAGDIELIYENETVYNGTITWIKVSTENISEAWISKKLIQEEDLKAAGIE